MIETITAAPTLFIGLGAGLILVGIILARIMAERSKG